MFSLKSKRKITIVIFVLLITIIVLLFTLKGCNSLSKNYKASVFPDLHFSDTNGYSPVAQDSRVEIPAVTGIEVRSDTLVQYLNISNPPNNQYVFVVELYLGDGTKLYTSEYIYPSDIITKVNFNAELPVGIYKDALMVYTCCTIDDSHTPLTRYEFPIEIRSSSE